MTFPHNFLTKLNSNFKIYLFKVFLVSQYYYYIFLFHSFTCICYSPLQCALFISNSYKLFRFFDNFKPPSPGPSSQPFPFARESPEDYYPTINYKTF